jgi:4-hydroxy-2-oxoheptanedioate aldolase
MAYDRNERPAGEPSGLAESSRGVWAFTADVDLLRRLAGAGFDWVALDAQHGPVDRAALHVVGRGLADAGVDLVVRVPAVDPVWIGAALDAGAAAVVVPSVTGRDDAALAGRASRYPPEGNRSWGPFAPLWGGTAPDPATANARVRCLVMVETTGALDDVDEVAATPGVDGLFVGPLDLALALGTTVDRLLEDHSGGNPLGRVVEAAQRHGILVAGFAGTRANARRLRAHGIRCLAVSTDVAVVAEGAAAVLADDEAG